MHRCGVVEDRSIVRGLEVHHVHETLRYVPPLLPGCEIRPHELCRHVQESFCDTQGRVTRAPRRETEAYRITQSSNFEEQVLVQVLLRARPCGSIQISVWVADTSKVG